MHEECQYLDLMQDILEKGTESDDRTGVGTWSIFGTQMRFDLSKSFPVLTTKRVYWRGVVEELLWFIRGETDSKILEEKKVNIWRDNTTREFLDKRGLDFPEGEIGPGYGWQMRNFGGTYEMRHRHEGDFLKGVKHLTKIKDGIDQLSNVVDQIKNNPNSRRIIMTLWNPKQVDKTALPPCHGICIQFYVRDGKLSCLMHQRSVDSFLGLPFNISSYSLLTCLLAKLNGLEPGELIWVGGDTHIYKNHINQVKEQLTRIPYEFPQLNIKKELNSLQDIEELNFEDLELIDYKCHPSIKAPMAI